MSLTVLCGPMSAGKTVELVKRLKAAAASGRKVAAYKPRIDNRGSMNSITDKDGNSFPCTAVEIAQEIWQDILRLKQEGVDLVVVDELQFFDNDLTIRTCVRTLAVEFDVVVAGLDMDFSNRPFDVVGYLCCVAEEVVKLQAECETCGGVATKSIRKSKSKERFLVGDGDEYSPACPPCHAAYEESREGIQ